MSDRSTMSGLALKSLSYLAGDGSTTLVNVAVFTLLLRYLGAVDYGYLAIAQVVSTWVQPVLYMGTNMIAVRMIATHPEAVRTIARRVFLLRLLAALAVSSVVLGITFRLSDPRLAAVLRAYLPLFFLYAMQPDFLMISLRKSALFARSRILTALLFLCGVALICRFHAAIVWVPLSYALAVFIGMVYTYRAILPELWGARRGDAPALSGMFPVVGAQFLQMGCTNIDVLILTLLLPGQIGRIGEYAAASRLMQMGVLPMMAIIYTSAPRLVESFTRGLGREFDSISRYIRRGMFAVGLAGATGMILVGPRALETLSGRQMPLAHELMPLFAIAFFLIGIHTPFSLFLPYLGEEWPFFRVNAIAFCTVAILNLLLIPRFGFFGAAAALALGILSLCFSGYFYYSRSIRRKEMRTGPLGAIPATASR